MTARPASLCDLALRWYVVRAGILGLIVTVLLPTICLAHEVRPAFLELREIRAGQFDMLFKTPMRGDLRLSLSPAFSGRAKSVEPVSKQSTGDAAVERWRVTTLDPLRGQTVRIDGLEGTVTDALVRIVFLDGTAWLRRLTPQEPAAVIPEQQSPWSVAALYLKLGVEHILLGFDHLLFVLALLIITQGTWRLVKTVTAFTVAHSITLALATLGYVHVPSAPVEAVIALSIVFVAVEIVNLHQGRATLTSRAPWIVAFAFGLLHGLGFAGALSEVGLPQGHVPLALLFFNVGVEIGQLLFIGVVLLLKALAACVRLPHPRWSDLVVPYCIGIIAMFWTIERIASL